MNRLILILLCFLPLNLFAQDAKPNEFFEKSFVTGKQQASQEEAKKEASATDQREKNFGLDQGYDGEKIISMGLIVDTLDTKHFEDAIQKLYNIVTRHDLNVNPLYPYGLNKAIYKNKHFKELILRTSNYDNIHDFPEEFKIEYSPTWIINTAEGRIVIEGEPNINKYVQFGKYYDKGTPEFLNQSTEKEEDKEKLADF